MTRAYVLQSGFVTTNPEKLVKSTAQDLTFKASLYVQDYRVQDTDHYYDEEVEVLFSRWWKDNSLMNRFEFREAVLKAALRVFRVNGSLNFLHFIQLQMPQRSVGYLHRRFLRDIVDYVFTHTAKTLDNLTYYRLLLADADLHPEGKDGSRINEALVQAMKQDGNAKLDYVVTGWSTDINALSDLLATMHVIFGRRQGTAGVEGKSA